MTPWFFRDSERLKRERDGVEQLANTAEWFRGYEWHLGEELYLDAIVQAHGHDYELRVSFPSLFPDAPAVVRPLNQSGRLSAHQYGGADGPLCLEWGPDNWHRDITAVRLLQSAHKLFELENPLGQRRVNVPQVAPSRHRLTLGQQVRGDILRWFCSDAFMSFVATQAHDSAGSFRFSIRKLAESWSVLIHEAVPPGGAVWKDQQIPANISETGSQDLRPGVWVKASLTKEQIVGATTIDKLRELLLNLKLPAFLDTEGNSPVKVLAEPLAGVLVSDKDGKTHLIITLSSGSVILCSPVYSDSGNSVNARAPYSNVLAGKKVGIVGLGSVGSKIAICLARMGVKQFYLSDHDVLLPENLHRHALDWAGVTYHKVDAVVDAVRRIAPDTKIEVSKIHLTGQESNAAISGVLNQLANCDVVVDATADPKVFNLLAAVSHNASKPLLWLEVFGGGVGGMLARSRPGIDPDPQSMRLVYLRFCNDNPAPAELAVATNYAAPDASGDVLVASDAEVSILAHHLSHLLPDSLLPPDQAKYPYSMYLVGLAPGWVFDAPFCTIPISMAGVSASQTPAASDLDPDNVSFLLELFTKAKK